MPGLASLAFAASMSSPLRPGDWFLAVTTMGHEPSLRLDDREGSTAVVRGRSPDVGNWHSGGLAVAPASVCLPHCVEHRRAVDCKILALERMSRHCTGEDGTNPG